MIKKILLNLSNSCPLKVLNNCLLKENKFDLKIDLKFDIKQVKIGKKLHSKYD